MCCRSERANIDICLFVGNKFVVLQKGLDDMYYLAGYTLDNFTTWHNAGSDYRKIR